VKIRKAGGIASATTPEPSREIRARDFGQSRTAGDGERSEEDTPE
jgi:hypothetical protein